MGIAGSARRYRTILKEQSVVIWKPKQIFDKSDRRGEISKETRPFALWANVSDNELLGAHRITHPGNSRRFTTPQP
jgi:hypothetical protein